MSRRSLPSAEPVPRETPLKTSGTGRLRARSARLLPCRSPNRRDPSSARMPQRLHASLLYDARYEHAPCRSRSTRNTAIPLGNQRRRDRQLQRAPPATTGGCGKGGTSLRRIAPNFEYSPNTVLRARVRECVGLVFPTLGANQKTSSGEVPINHRLPIAVVVRHRPAGSGQQPGIPDRHGRRIPSACPHDPGDFAPGTP